MTNIARNLKQQANKYQERNKRNKKYYFLTGRGDLKKYEANQAANRTIKLTQSTVWLLSCQMECCATFAAFLHVKGVLSGAVKPENKTKQS